MDIGFVHRRLVARNSLEDWDWLSLCMQSIISQPTDILSITEQDPAALPSSLVRLLSSYILHRLRNFEEDESFSIERRTALDSDETLERIDSFSRTLGAFGDANESVKAVFGGSYAPDAKAIIKEFQFVLERAETVGRSLREQLVYTASIASLKKSRLGIQQNRSVNKLTQLAFVFIPLTFITSVFGMNIVPLSGDRARWWTVLVGAVICYAILTITLFLLNEGVKDWLFDAKVSLVSRNE